MLDQAQAVYAWEGTFLLSKYQMFETVISPRKAIAWACHQYGLKPPTVVGLAPNRTHSFYRNLDNRIGLLPCHWNLWCALHEAAHFIMYKFRDDMSHEGFWLSTLMTLLSEAKIIPIEALKASAKAAGLKFTPLWRVHPRMFLDHPAVTKSDTGYKGPQSKAGQGK